MTLYEKCYQQNKKKSIIYEIIKVKSEEKTYTICGFKLWVWVKPRSTFNLGVNLW